MSSNAGLLARSAEYTLLELAVDFAESRIGVVGYGSGAFEAPACSLGMLEVEMGGPTGFLVTIVLVLTGEEPNALSVRTSTSGSCEMLVPDRDPSSEALFRCGERGCHAWSILSLVLLFIEVLSPLSQELAMYQRGESRWYRGILCLRVHSSQEIWNKAARCTLMCGASDVPWLCRAWSGCAIRSNLDFSKEIRQRSTMHRNNGS